MTEGQGSGDVRALVRIAVGRLAPDELSRFDDVWLAYLDNPRSSRHILQSGDAALGAGIEVIGTAMTPLLVAVTGEALADLVKEPAAGAARKITSRLGRAGNKRAARRAALKGPAPDPAALEHTVMHALFFDIAKKADCTDESATAVADTLVSVFTQRPVDGIPAGSA